MSRLPHPGGRSREGSRTGPPSASSRLLVTAGAAAARGGHSRLGAAWAISGPRNAPSMMVGMTADDAGAWRRVLLARRYPRQERASAVHLSAGVRHGGLSMPG